MQVREGSIASLGKIMVECGVGVLWRADSHKRKVKVVNGVGGDRGGNGIILPILVRCTNKDYCTNETKTDDYKPKNLG